MKCFVIQHYNFLDQIIGVIKKNCRSQEMIFRMKEIL